MCTSRRTNSVEISRRESKIMDVITNYTYVPYVPMYTRDAYIILCFASAVVD